MLFVILSGIAALVLFVYYAFYAKYKYFENRGVPGPKPKFPFGNTPNIFLMKRNLIYDLDDIYK